MLMATPPLPEGVMYAYFLLVGGTMPLIRM
jgi:hypothetical protein